MCLIIGEDSFVITSRQQVFILALNVFSSVLSIVLFLRASCCFPAVVKTRSIPPPDPGQPSYVNVSAAMQILIPSTDSAATILLILSSPYGCICLTSLKITSTQGKLYVPSVTSSMNSLSSSSFLDMDRALFFRHRSWTWTEPYSFEQATSQT